MGKQYTPPPPQKTQPNPHSVTKYWVHTECHIYFSPLFLTGPVNGVISAPLDRKGTWDTESLGYGELPYSWAVTASGPKRELHSALPCLPFLPRTGGGLCPGRRRAPTGKGHRAQRGRRGTQSLTWDTCASGISTPTGTSGAAPVPLPRPSASSG